jgi:hypothetical protein
MYDMEPALSIYEPDGWHAGAARGLTSCTMICHDAASTHLARIFVFQNGLLLTSGFPFDVGLGAASSVDPWLGAPPTAPPRGVPIEAGMAHASALGNLPRKLRVAPRAVLLPVFGDVDPPLGDGRAVARGDAMPPPRNPFRRGVQILEPFDSLGAARDRLSGLTGIWSGSAGAGSAVGRITPTCSGEDTNAIDELASVRSRWGAGEDACGCVLRPGATVSIST